MAARPEIANGVGETVNLADQLPLRIAITADPEIPVPPIYYGGIERVIDMLARGLTEREHDVTVFAHRDLITAGKLVPWPGGASGSLKDTLRNAATLTRTVVSQRFDLVHSFSKIAYLGPLLPFKTPKLMTYQRHITPRSVRLGNLLSRKTLWFSAISRWMMRDVEHLGTWRLVFKEFRSRHTPSAKTPALMHRLCSSGGWS